MKVPGIPQHQVSCFQCLVLKTAMSLERILKLWRSLSECYLVEGACNIITGNVSGLLLQNHRVIPVRRDLRRSLVQTPTPSRIRYEERTGCSGLYPVRSWKPLRTETVQLWKTYVCVCAHGKIFFFPYIQSEPVLFYLMPVVSCSSAVYCCGEPGSYLLDSLSIGAGRLLLGLSKTFFSPGWTSPVP